MRLYTSELVKKYKSRTVVDHVSIDVNQGEIVGLLGPNGAGKTTTFYMIVGLIKPNEGRIFLENDQHEVSELTDLPVYRLDNRADEDAVNLLAAELNRIS